MESSNFKLRSFVATVALALCTLLGLTSCPFGWNEGGCILRVNPKELVFSANDTEEQIVTVRTDDKAWFAVSSVSWIIASRSSKDDNHLYVNVEPYSNTSMPRVGTITVGAGTSPNETIVVTQEAQCICSIYPTSLTFAWDDKDEQRINIITNSITDWSYSNSPDWLSCKKEGGALFVKPIDNNTGLVARKAVILIAAGSSEIVELTVTQNPRQPILTVSPTTITLTSNSQPRILTVTSNVNWTVSSSASPWLMVTPTSGSNNGTITIYTTANTNSTSRSAFITIKSIWLPDRIITVTQTGGPVSPNL